MTFEYNKRQFWEYNKLYDKTKKIFHMANNKIIKNIIKWCHNKILFLTLHTKEAQEIGFSYVIKVENGVFKF